jgi:tRNA 2-thiouridine synthesizing protein A
MTPRQEKPIIIDGGDSACVTLLLELRARLAPLPAGTLVQVLASDPAAPIDLPAWCHLTGHHHLGPTDPASETPGYALRVTAEARPTRPDAPWHPAS